MKLFAIGFISARHKTRRQKANFFFSQTTGVLPLRENYPSMKIASSRALSSWNCRSMSAPSSWKSGTSSSAQYPATMSRDDVLPLPFSFPSIALASFYTLSQNYTTAPLETARVRGTWQRVICFVTRARSRASPKKRRILF